ncbi:MAG: GTP 3',8-cyclase MoaA [Candidatus Woesearchaeota archaeon]
MIIDSLGREKTHLRLSVTEKCNLDCFYCHKEGSVENEAEMSLIQIKSLLEAANAAGITTLKLTGGEPLLREDIVQIVSIANSIGYLEVSLVTNGLMLPKYAQQLSRAGLDRVNIGCDSLSEALPKNTERIKSAILFAKKANIKVKLNMVVLKGVNDTEIFPMLDFCMQYNVNLQLIELIKLGRVTDEDYQRLHLPLLHIEKHLAEKCDWQEKRKMQARKRYHFGTMFVETVTPSPQFCESCNKIRISADGRIKECLMKEAVPIQQSAFAPVLQSRPANRKPLK